LFSAVIHLHPTTYIHLRHACLYLLKHRYCCIAETSIFIVMSFYSQKDYLEKAKALDEMQMKNSAPLLSRPNSPERKAHIRLEDIPEATPGPNAFAQEAARIEQYRLDTNAFYQQEVQKRKITPPTAIHPALRPRSNSDPPTPPRLSDCTTMSPFINVGKRGENSPPLKLIPDSASDAEPTQRGYIEELKEQILHERSKRKEERIPVFVSTPKLNAGAFERAKPFDGHRSTQKEAAPTAPADLPTKTPKKSLFEKLRLTTNLLGISSPAASIVETSDEVAGGEKIPVKAKAVFGPSPPKKKPRASLGSSPSKLNLARSPSKRKGFFARKHTDLPTINSSTEALTRRSADLEHPPPSASTVIQTPPTAFSDPTHYSYQGKRLASQSHSEQDTAGKEKEVNKSIIARSQSLKYFDHAVPPTPPAKNTPPDEKAKSDAAMKAGAIRIPFHDDQTTPSKSPTGIVSISGRVSPTKFGNYAHRDEATLVTRPSVYSMHASVIPNLTEANTFEEMKARLDGLGLEGFSLPPENNRSPAPSVRVSPSIYSTQFSPRPNSAFAKLSPATPQDQLHSPNPSTDTKSSSRNGDIPIIYPELAKDPSINTLTPANETKGPAKTGKVQQPRLLDASVPFHGYTHSRDHSQSPRHSVDSLIFAHHVDDDLKDAHFESPSAFSYASATPSPLQFLPKTTYSPLPPRKSSKRPLKPVRSTEAPHNLEANGTNALGISTPSRGKSSSPDHRNSIFENAPTLPAQASTTNSRKPSPSESLRGMPSDADANVDPLKISPARSPSSDKLNRMIDMLNQLKLRNDNVNNMREEMRASTARLDERISAMEGSQKASPWPPSDENVDEWGMRGRNEQQRISTNVAHDFYRVRDEHQEHESAAEAERDEGSNTIAKLMETNKRLLEMCGGFADKIKALEEKFNRDV
jgi:hypothetical protein